MDDKPSADAPSWHRWAARGAIMAAFLCFAINCVFMQLTRDRAPDETRVANQVVGWASMAVVIAGVVAGIFGLAGGIRRRSLDTSLIAAIGLFLCGGIIFVRLWMLYLIRQGQA